jgi:DNA-binding transcriptional LysR family regulator
MIENLQALVAVVEARSLTKATARLYVTQSAVSRRLQQLEETLGADLFDRAQRPPAPTAMGLRVYEQALPILQSVEDLLAMTKEKADPAGILRLGMAQGIGDFALGEAVERLRTDFPKLDLPCARTGAPGYVSSWRTAVWMPRWCSCRRRPDPRWGGRVVSSALYRLVV